MKNEKQASTFTTNTPTTKKDLGKKCATSIRPMRSMVRLKSLKPKSITQVMEFKIDAKELN